MNFKVVIKKMKPKSEKEKSGVFRTPHKKIDCCIFSTTDCIHSGFYPIFFLIPHSHYKYK